MGRHDRDQSLSYLLAELESSNPQKIFPAIGFLGKTYALEAERLHLSYTLRSGMENSIPSCQRISKKMDGLGFGLAGPQCLPVDSSAMRLLQSTYPLRLRAASLLYTLRSGMENGPTPRPSAKDFEKKWTVWDSAWLVPSACQ